MSICYKGCLIYFYFVIIYGYRKKWTSWTWQATDFPYFKEILHHFLHRTYYFAFTGSFTYVNGFRYRVSGSLQTPVSQAPGLLSGTSQHTTLSQHSSNYSENIQLIPVTCVISNNEFLLFDFELSHKTILS